MKVEEEHLKEISAMTVFILNNTDDVQLGATAIDILAILDEYNITNIKN